MLVLSLRPRQRILFPDLDITVQVLNVKGSTVRMGIETPPGVDAWFPKPVNALQLLEAIRKDLGATVSEG